MKHTICPDQNKCKTENGVSSKGCQNFKKDGSCYFKEKCAYKHIDHVENQS